MLFYLFVSQLPVPPTCDCVQDRPTCDCAGSLKTSILRPSALWAFGGRHLILLLGISGVGIWFYSLLVFLGSAFGIPGVGVWSYSLFVFLGSAFDYIPYWYSWGRHWFYSLLVFLGSAFDSIPYWYSWGRRLIIFPIGIPGVGVWLYSLLVFLGSALILLPIGIPV